MILGIGTDAVDVARVERMVSKHGDRLLERLFTHGELEYARGKAHPAQHLAVRLAAKEAAYKALAGNALARAIGWQDTEVTSREDGSPELVFHGRAKTRHAELVVQRTHVSLSHTETTAIAIVVLEG
jgi:holo-[acyl-carrier protein] synthase